jgi:hypothetical protein
MEAAKPRLEKSGRQPIRSQRRITKDYLLIDVPTGRRRRGATYFVNRREVNPISQ